MNSKDFKFNVLPNQNFGKYNYKTMSRPKPTVLLQHSNKTTYKMDEVLAAEGIWAVFYDGKPISIELPNQVDCKVETTDATLKGQTVSSSYKPAILENGLKVQVPPFVEAEDEIILDTRTLEYVKKI